MFDIGWNASIGKFNLQLLDSIVIVKSVDKLSDTASIVLPGAAYNQALNVEEYIARGDKVLIQIGYDDNLVDEFVGYLESIATDDGSIQLNCEDAIFLYRVSLDDIQFKNITLTQLLQYVNTKVSAYYPNDPPFTLSCDYEYTYNKFTISNANAYDVLKKIQEEAKPNIYLKDRVLHVHPKYVQLFGSADYDFSVNIEKSELKYKKADERKVEIEIDYTPEDGKTQKITFGTTGGEKIKIKAGTTDKNSLLLQAQQEYSSHVYEGYEGHFVGWLIPYCESGYKISLHDADYPEKDGNYYVIEVKTELSKAGGVRTIQIGKKIS